MNKNRSAALIIIVLIFPVTVTSADPEKKLGVQHYLDTSNFDRIEECNRGTTNGNYRECNDGTVSFVQPTVNGAIDPGLCVHTALANIICMQCGTCLDPLSYIGEIGVMPNGGATSAMLMDALLKGLQSAKRKYCKEALWKVKLPTEPFHGRSFTGPDGKESDVPYSPLYLLERWVYGARDHSSEPYSADYYPVVVFLNSPDGESGHATTVVGIDHQVDDAGTWVDYYVRHNTWGLQYKTPWAVFFKLWRHGGDAIYLANG